MRTEDRGGTARLDRLETRTASLEARLARLEGRPTPVRDRSTPHGLPAAAPREPRARAAVAPHARDGRPAPAATLRRPLRTTPPIALEDLLGGRVLAWIGGLAVLIGIFFLFAIGISRGWIGESGRTAMGAVGSLLLLGAGAWLRERRARTDAAMAAAAAGIAGLFGAVTVATLLYDLIPAIAGIVLGLAVGALATGLAIRWNARVIGALGIVGAVAAPAVVGAEATAVTLALLLAANASAVGVLLWRRWDWLALAVFALATGQWIAWLYSDDRSLVAIVAVLGAFGALAVAGAVGLELRVRSPVLRISAHALLALNALVLAAAGAIALDQDVSATAAQGWLAALALAHLAVGLGSGRMGRVSRELALAATGIGVVLADVAFAASVDGLPLVLGWAATGAGFAALLARSRRPGDVRFAAVGLGGHLASALTHALAFDAPVGDIGAGSPDAAGIVALAGVAAGCLVSGRLARAGHGTVRMALDGLGLAVVAYLGASALEGAALTTFWAGQAAALALIARRTGDRVAAAGGLALLGGALTHGVAFLAPPAALLDGLQDPAAAALGLGAVVGAALACARVRPALYAVAAAVALHLASTALVTPFQSANEETGQALMSGLWALVGVAALLAGLARDRRSLRTGALALLAITIAKVFLFDLASLSSLSRVASFVALGLLLLAAAFAWQRIRPAAPRSLDPPILAACRRRMPAS